MSKYTGRITSYHASKPLFFAHVDLSTRPFIDTSTATESLVNAFDIDTAVGVQLDALGQWIGRSRVIGQFTAHGGSTGEPDVYVTLSDETYRVILKAKIAINNWDGQNDSLPSILDAATAGSGLRMQIVDNQDMTISVWAFPVNDISEVSSELIAAIRQGYLTVKASGIWAGDIETPSVEVPSAGNRFFGFDMDNQYIAGFDDGAWERKL
ncbi:Protein of uncharacterised function (DUF2612) [Cedecea lapagei]|uniref:Protein of uncharacterized function (DUF2612) n=1 Tax=Cedecea lapagei TaxID=158823 RepID=A0A447UYN0_9ENTR|nr:DUF2612 domain-containing protein [Cedecea lapagei]VEB95796.1 Protein of uncharacterised function (DUF2612) [Cedecea lapagei]